MQNMAHHCISSWQNCWVFLKMDHAFLASFQRKSEFQNVSAEQTIKTLIEALNTVGLEGVASQLCCIQKNVRSVEAENTELRTRQYSSEVHIDVGTVQGIRTLHQD